MDNQSIMEEFKEACCSDDFAKINTIIRRRKKGNVTYLKFAIKHNYIAAAVHILNILTITRNYKAEAALLYACGGDSPSMIKAIIRTMTGNSAPKNKILSQCLSILIRNDKYDITHDVFTSDNISPDSRTRLFNRLLEYGTEKSIFNIVRYAIENGATNLNNMFDHVWCIRDARIVELLLENKADCNKGRVLTSICSKFMPNISIVKALLKTSIVKQTGWIDQCLRDACYSNNSYELIELLLGYSNVHRDQLLAYACNTHFINDMSPDNPASASERNIKTIQLLLSKGATDDAGICINKAVGNANYHAVKLLLELGHVKYLQLNYMKCIELPIARYTYKMAIEAYGKPVKMHEDTALSMLSIGVNPDMIINDMKSAFLNIKDANYIKIKHTILSCCNIVAELIDITNDYAGYDIEWYLDTYKNEPKIMCLLPMDL